MEAIGGTMLEKINYTNLFTKTNLFIAFFGILPAAGYLVGISYYQGRLSAYGVSSDTFPLALQDIYVEAFWAVGLWLLTIVTGIVAILKKLTTLPGLYWSVITILTVTYIAYISIKYKSHVRPFLREKLKPVKKVIDYLDWEKNAFSKAIGITSIFSYSLISILWVVMLIPVCWVGLPFAAYYKGRDDATTAINSYLEKGCYIRDGEKWSNCKSLQTGDGKQIFEGILVAHTNGYVAFFNKTGSLVARFPDDGVIVSKLQ